jgi:hypothetical protein
MHRYASVFCSWAEVFSNTFSYFLSKELALNAVALNTLLMKTHFCFNCSNTRHKSHITKFSNLLFQNSDVLQASKIIASATC